MTIHDGTCERIVQACAEGKTRKELMALFGMTGNKVSNALKTLVGNGRLSKDGHWCCRFTATGVPSKRPRRTPEERKAHEAERRRLKAAEKAPKVPAWSTPKGVPLTKAKRADIEPTIPPHVKVQYIPHGEDYRFKVDPSIAGRGQISQDYFARRQGGGA
jgi:DNA-binding CsgD family transcriptional regulator